MDYLLNHSKLVEATGGKVVDNLFITKFGVQVITETKSVISPEIIDIFNINPKLSETHNILELNSKITYLNFNKTNDDFVEDIYNNKKHTSISSNLHIGFIIAGVSGETVLEFVSSFANISRETTSRTLANLDTLYVVEDELDIEYARKFLSLRNEYIEKRNNKYIDSPSSVKEKRNRIERINKFNLFTKALSFTISMSLDNWIWYLDKKINNDYEIEFQKVCLNIYNILKNKYPDFVK